MMQEITESDLITIIGNTKKALLIEPQYVRKYLPLGLAKIATAIKSNGGEVNFSRYYIPGKYDAIFVTSLFTYDSKKVHKSIPLMTHILNKSTPVYVGGIYASLMPEHIKKHMNVQIFTGCSPYLDQCTPDYTIDYQLKDPWDKFSYCFTTRGCPNKCAYCAVWRIEKEHYIIDGWEKSVDVTRPYLMISDNNLSSFPETHLQSVTNFVYNSKKTVLFNNGFDCKYITPDIAKELGRLKYMPGGGMRVAFDRIEEDGELQNAVKLLLKHGIGKSKILSFVLFNFDDTPQEANYRATECVKLGIRPYPQQYTPLNQTSRKNVYIGKHWTKNLVTAFRFFWLMAGYYTKMSFMDYIKKSDRYTFTDEDMEKWNYLR